MAGPPTTPAQLLKSLPPDRREAIEAVRKVILDNLDDDFEEGIQYGMLGYYVPHSVYPAGYHCDPRQPVPFAGLASQKNYMSLYLMCVYGNPKQEAWFKKAWAKSGKKLDMGKSCLRFKKLDDLALDVIGEVIRRITARDFLASYQAILAQPSPRRRKVMKKKASAKKASAKKASAKKASAKKAAAKKTAAKKSAAKESATKKTAAKKSAAKKAKTKSKATKKRASKR